MFQASLSIWGWGGLGVVLFLVTFGPFAIFYLAFYIFCFIGGWARRHLNHSLCLYISTWSHINHNTVFRSLTDQFIAVLSFSLLFSRGFTVTLLYGKINSEKHLEKCEHSYLPPTQIGILKVKACLNTPNLTSPTQTNFLAFNQLPLLMKLPCRWSKFSLIWLVTWLCFFLSPSDIGWDEAGDEAYKDRQETDWLKLHWWTTATGVYVFVCDFLCQSSYITFAPLTNKETV